jgi:hypothetical protein
MIVHSIVYLTPNEPAIRSQPSQVKVPTRHNIIPPIRMETTHHISLHHIIPIPTTSS